MITKNETNGCLSIRQLAEYYAEMVAEGRGDEAIAHQSYTAEHIADNLDLDLGDITPGHLDGAMAHLEYWGERLIESIEYGADEYAEYEEMC